MYLGETLDVGVYSDFLNLEYTDHLLVIVSYFCYRVVSTGRRYTFRR